MAVVPPVLAAVALGGPSVGAQTDPGGDGGVDVGGSVPSEIAMMPGAVGGFVRVGRTDTYRMSIPVSVTSTETVTQLSIADGLDVTGPAHGHLRNGHNVLTSPLAVGLAGRRSQSLAAPFDPRLLTWKVPLAQQPAKISLQQSSPSGTAPAPPLHTVVLVTVSSSTP